MIRFILLSTGCQILFLAVYKLWLEREKMLVFNRFFLVFGLLFSLLLPWLNFEVVTRVEIVPVVAEMPVVVPTTSDPVSVNAEDTDYLPMIIGGIYALAVTVLLVRFSVNLFQILRRIIRNPKKKSSRSTLVLLSDESAPHSFFRYVFLNRDAYENQRLAPELLTHENIHVRQWHSLDILLGELFQIVFWFNPLLPAYRKAIRLNHEFLADASVLEKHPSAYNYQQLLLTFALLKTPEMTSGINFSITKKRFEMMTNNVSRRRILLKKIGLSVLLPMAVAAITVKAVAQQITAPSTDPKKYYSKTVFRISDKNGKTVSKSYDELTDEEKKAMAHEPHPPKANPVTAANLKEWQNKKKYAIWIDDRVQQNSVLTGKKTTDFASHFSSFVFKNARSQRFPQEYQVHIYTPAFYDSYIKDVKAPGTIVWGPSKVATQETPKPEKFYKNTKFSLIKPNGSVAEKKYRQLSDDQKKALPDPAISPEHFSRQLTLRDSGSSIDVIHDMAGIVEKPEFQGGISKFYEYFSKNFKYTKEAVAAKINGRIFISFEVEKDGKITGVKVLRGLGYGLDEEAVRVMKNSPDWTPGTFGNQAVVTSYQLPIMIVAE